MELKIKDFAVPASIDFNFEELKQELEERVKLYENTVYTEEQIKLAKSDRAGLNKLKKALNDERIRREREYMAPFNDFKAKINEIISIIDKPVCLIDSQVKAYEEKCRDEKLSEIKTFWDGLNHPEWLNLGMIFQERWLNASVSMKSISDEINAKLVEVYTAVDTLSNLPEFGFEATEAYKTTLDLNAALNEGRRLSEIQKRKEEHERMRREAEEQAKLAEKSQPVEEVSSPEELPKEPVESPFSTEECKKTWLSFRVNISIPEALELRAFFEERGIEFEAIR